MLVFAGLCTSVGMSIVATVMYFAKDVSPRDHSETVTVKTWSELKKESNRV